MKKIGFLGSGNLAQSIVGALVKSKTVKPEQIFISNRSAGKLQKMSENFGVQTASSNEELVEKSDIIFLATKPQDLFSAIEPIAMSFESHHTVISLAAGVQIQRIQKVLSQSHNIVRVMTNIPVKIQKAVVGYCLGPKASGVEDQVEELLKPLGYVVAVAEGEPFEALTVACSGGTGFVLELMSYWQDWLEDYGFDEETARKMTIETFLGASQLISEGKQDILDLQNQVVSKKGITQAGLESMRELEIERLLRYSFEKAVLRDRELGQSQS